ncbi:MAG: P1 family peptidase [Leptospirales bacterium]
MKDSKTEPETEHGRMRLRDLGIKIGHYPTGRFNAITDVAGVQVGHSTIINGSGKGELKPGQGAARTGVTAILPNNRNIFLERMVGSAFVLNGAGEISGLTQAVEWGMIETPILLTNTMSVGAVSEAAVKYMVEEYPGIGSKHDVVIPLVGECDDSWLNDVQGRYVRDTHVFEAIKNASSGPVPEGCVGGGTGMVTCDFKAGIGTSSRKLPVGEGGYTVGVLVMSNFGVRDDLRINGVHIGPALEEEFAGIDKRVNNYGSIIAVVATDAPLSSAQIARVCKRAALGIGRCGSYAAHNSGEIVLGFSTANVIPRYGNEKNLYEMKILLEAAVDPIYKSVIECTEEAILNSLCMAETMTGHSGHTAPALPLVFVRMYIVTGRP